MTAIEHKRIFRSNGNDLYVDGVMIIRYICLLKLRIMYLQCLHFNIYI